LLFDTRLILFRIVKISAGIECYQDFIRVGRCQRGQAGLHRKEAVSIAFRRWSETRKDDCILIVKLRSESGVIESDELLLTFGSCGLYRFQDPLFARIGKHRGPKADLSEGRSRRIDIPARTVQLGEKLIIAVRDQDDVTSDARRRSTRLAYGIPLEVRGAHLCLRSGPLRLRLIQGTGAKNDRNQLLFAIPNEAQFYLCIRALARNT